MIKMEKFTTLKKNQLDTEFIYFAHILDGVIQAGTWRGSYLDNGIIKFNKYFDQIRIERINTAYVFDKDNPLSRSNNANISNLSSIQSKLKSPQS